MLLSPRGPAPVSLVIGGHTSSGGWWHFSFVLLFNPLLFSSFTPLIAKQVWYHSLGAASRCWRTLAKPFLLPKSPDRPLVSPLLRYQPHDWSPPKSEHHVNNLSFPFPHQNLCRNKQQKQQQSQNIFSALTSPTPPRWPAMVTWTKLRSRTPPCKEENKIKSLNNEKQSYFHTDQIVLCRSCIMPHHWKDVDIGKDWTSFPRFCNAHKEWSMGANYRAKYFFLYLQHI